MGSCTAGGAYVPAMSDETVIVRNQGTIFLGGPPLVKAATGEVVTAEELGGGDVHARRSGVVDHLAEDDAHALAHRCARDRRHLRRRPARAVAVRATRASRLRTRQTLYDVVPTDPRTPYDVREVIRRIVDGCRLHEFKPLYGETLVCGFAHIWGYPVGILANNGILFSESALKGAHFIELCNQRGIPLVFLQNITGFMVGREYENRGIAKRRRQAGHRGRLLRSSRSSPSSSAARFGAGNYGMCGRAYDPRFLWMWPNARISVMGGEQAAVGAGDGAPRRDRGPRGGAGRPRPRRRSRTRSATSTTTQGSPYYSTARLWDDGIIDPADTRRVLGLALAATAHAPVPAPSYGVFRM